MAGTKRGGRLKTGFRDWAVFGFFFSGKAEKIGNRPAERQADRPGPQLGLVALVGSVDAGTDAARSPRGRGPSSPEGALVPEDARVEAC